MTVDKRKSTATVLGNGSTITNERRADVDVLVSLRTQWLSHSGQSTNFLIMVAVCNRADHYIFALWFLLMAVLRSRCEHYIFALRFFMVALCNRADHYIFILFYGRPM